MYNNQSLIFPFLNYTGFPYPYQEILIPSLPGEVWAPITDFATKDVVPNMYYVSTFGRAYTNGKRKQFLELVKTQNGYYRINLRRTNGPPRYSLIHRIIMITFYPVPNYDILQVNHKDGNKANNQISNLEWVTCSENIRHAFRINLKKYGEQNPTSVYTDEQIDKVGYYLSLNNYSYQQISELTGVSKSQIANINNGLCRASVKEKYNLKPKFTRVFNDMQIHDICKEFQLISINGVPLDNECFKIILNKLNIDINDKTMRAIYRIYNRSTHKLISDNYDF